MRRLSLGTIALALAIGCGDSSKESAPTATGAANAAAAPVDDAPLGFVSGKEVSLPSGTDFVALDGRGGKVERDGASAVFAPGDVEGDAQVALVSVEKALSWPAGFAQKVTPSGRRFALVTRGTGVIRGGKLVVTFDPASVPEGSEAQLVCHHRVGRAGPLPTEGQPPPWREQADAKRDKEVAEKARLARERENRKRWPEPRAAEFAAFVCLSKKETGRIEAPITQGDAPGLAWLFELVFTRDVRHEHVLEGGKLVACVYYVDPPAHDREEYERRIAAALRLAREKARELGLPVPEQPIAITVVPEIKIPFGDSLLAATSGARMALRSDLLAAWPRGDPSLLEYAVAHEYAHVIQSFSMTVDTFGAEFNGWGLEGGAEWFARKIYPNFHESWWQGPLRGLEGSNYDAAPFWICLEERFGDRVMADTLSLLRGRALGGREMRDPSLQIAYGLRLEKSSFTEALDRVLHSHGSSLSDAFAGFAVSWAYLRDFARGDQGTEERSGLWYGLSPRDFPACEGWSEHSLAYATETDPVRLDDLTVKELSAAAVRYVSRFDRGTLHLKLKEPKCFRGAMESGDTSKLGPPRLRLFVFGEKEGREPELLHDIRVGAEGAELEVRDFGRGGGWESAAVVVVNAGWRRRHDEGGGSSRVVQEEIGDVGYRLFAYLDGREAARAPSTSYVTAPKASKRWGISKTRSVDEEGNRCFGTFAAAISNKEVEDGHELVVDPGTYEEQVAVTKGLILKPKVPGTVTIVASGQVVSIAAPDVTVANFRLIGGKNLVPVVGIANGAFNAAVLGNIIVSGGPGVGGSKADGVQIARNWIACSQAGVNLYECSGVTVTGNVIAPPVARETLSAPDTTGAHVEVPGLSPTIIDPAIRLYVCSRATVEGNESVTFDWLATGSFDHGLSANRVEGLTVRGNLFRTDSGEGVSLVGTKGATIADNLLVGHVGLSASDGSDLTISGNTAEGRFHAMSLKDVSDVTLERNLHCPGRTSWALVAGNVKGATITEDRIGVGVGGGAVLTACESVAFDRVRLFGYDTAAELNGDRNVSFTACTFEHAASEDRSDTPGDGGGIVVTRSEQVLVRDGLFRGPFIAAVVTEGTHPTWENLRLVTGSVAGVCASKTTLALDKIAMNPGTEWPLHAGEGTLRVRDLRFAYAEGPPVALVPSLSLESGALELTPLTQVCGMSVTSLTPWWWRVHASGGDYRMKYEVDLGGVRLPTPPIPKELRICSIWGDPPYLPGTADNPLGMVRAETSYAVENPDGWSMRAFGIVLQPE